MFRELCKRFFGLTAGRYARSKLQEIHEFNADEATAGQGTMKRDHYIDLNC